MKFDRTTFALVLAMAALLALPLVAQAGHWPNFGGDAGHSGNQPVDPATMAVEFEARFAAAGEDRTSLVVSGGDAVTGGRVSHGRYVDVAGTADDQTLIHIRDLATGAERVPIANQAIDDDTGASATDDETLGDAGSDEFVTPVSSSPEGGLGQLFVIHNDADSVAAADNGCPPGTGGQSNASQNDIAIARFDEATGAQLEDVAVGQAAGNAATIPIGMCPTADRPQVSNGYRVESAPVLTPPLDASGRRLLFFTARPVAGTTGRLFRLEIGNAASRDATLTDVTAPQFRDIPNLNAEVSPAIAYLSDPGNGAVVPYVVVGIDAGPGASDVRAFKAEDIGTGEIDLEAPSDLSGNPVAISIPSTERGELPSRATGDVKAPAIYVSYVEGESTRVRRFVQEGSNETFGEVAASPALEGTPGPGMALSTVVSGGEEQAGRVIVTTSRNLFVLDNDALSVAERLADTGEPALEPGVTGFRRNAPLHSGGYVFVQDDGGTPYVLDLATADRVAESDFTPDAGHLASATALGQPAYSDGVLLFSTDLGVFKYATGVPTPPNEAPVARFSATPNPAGVGQQVTLDASGTTDPENLGIARYEWDLDGNGTYEIDGGTSPRTTAAYPATGSYTVGLRVTDVAPRRAAARTGTTTQTVVVGSPVANQPPVASFTVSPNPARPSARVMFDASASSDPEGAAIARHEWDLDGDGTYETNTGTNPRVERSYATRRVYDVRLRVTDAQGAGSEATRQLTVAGAGERGTPRISAKVTPTRDRRLPYVFRTAGRVTLPTGVTRAVGCRGRVTVTVKAGRKTISRRTTALSARCTYATKVTFRDRKRIGSRPSLRFTARFQGNDALVARQAKTVTVRVR